MTTQPTTKPPIQIAREARRERSHGYSDRRLKCTRRTLLIIGILKQKKFWASTESVCDAINHLMIETWSFRTVIRDLHLLANLGAVRRQGDSSSGYKWRFDGLESLDFLQQWDGEDAA